MNTDELISVLARRLEPVPRHFCTRRLGGLSLAGLAISSALLAVFYGVNPALAEALESLMGAVKIGPPVALGAAAIVAVYRLARPGMSVGLSLPILFVGFIVWWLHALASWWEAPPLMRSAMV